jgi:hypothetical protein
VASRLEWDERALEPYASALRLYAALLALRRDVLAPGSAADARTAEATDQDTIVLRRTCRDGAPIVIVARLRGEGVADLESHTLVRGVAGWTCLLTTEDEGFGPAATRPVVDCTGTAPRIRFDGPAAVILKATPGPDLLPVRAAMVAGTDGWSPAA